MKPTKVQPQVPQFSLDNSSVTAQTSLSKEQLEKLRVVKVISGELVAGGSKEGKASISVEKSIERCAPAIGGSDKNPEVTKTDQSQHEKTQTGTIQNETA